MSDTDLIKIFLLWEIARQLGMGMRVGWVVIIFTVICYLGTPRK